MVRGLEISYEALGFLNLSLIFFLSLFLFSVMKFAVLQFRWGVSRVGKKASGSGRSAPERRADSGRYFKELGAAAAIGPATLPITSLVREITGLSRARRILFLSAERAKMPFDPSAAAEIPSALFFF